MFFDRPESGEIAILVHIDFSRGDDPEDPREFEELVLSAQGDPAAFLLGRRTAPDPKFFIGSGKLEELRTLVLEYGAQVVIFNHVLSPSQERNLEKELKCRVLDRVGLILDIFAQRARTHEGKLQVELAQLQHLSTRLIRGWTHLERQKGGIGLRGPGETQLETDRRLVRGRIRAIEARLEKVRKQREQGRRARRRAAIPTVSLVGYTNAGKSTLFNRLTEAGVFAEDQLFATLDPTMRRLRFPDVGPVILADTVGFISHLPHRLVEAFRATLEEVASADLLLHVIDASCENPQQQIDQVNAVLEEIGADDRPQLKVFNKIDLIDGCVPRLDCGLDGHADAIWLSAQTGVGIDILMQAVGSMLSEDLIEQTLHLSADLARLRAKLYQQKAIVSEHHLDDGSSDVTLRLAKADLLRLLSAENLRWQDLNWRNQQRA